MAAIWVVAGSIVDWADLVAELRATARFAPVRVNVRIEVVYMLMLAKLELDQLRLEELKSTSNSPIWKSVAIER